MTPCRPIRQGFGTYLANGAGIDLVGVGAARASGDTKYLRNFCWTTTAFTPIITTLNWTALPPPAPVNYNWIESTPSPCLSPRPVGST